MEPAVSLACVLEFVSVCCTLKNTSICACSLKVSSNLRRYFYFEDISCFQYLYFISPGEALQGRKITEGLNIFIREV